MGAGALVLAPTLPASAQQFQDQSGAPNNRFPAPTGSDYSNQVCVADIDNDGDLDLIWANGGGYNSATAPQILRVFGNNGSGFFTDVSIATHGGLTFRARGVEAGDCDNDGDLDLIVAQDFQGQPSLLINQGPGPLLGTYINGTAGRIPAGVLSSSRGQFADVDNDGDLDIMFCNGGTSRFGSGPTKLFINNGSGVYTDESVARLPVGNISQPMDVIFADIDGDLDLDVRVVGLTANTTKLWRNNGAGVFTNITPQPSDANGYSYDFGDINGDGDMDLLGANAAPGSTAELLLSNNGTGTYSVSAFPAASIDDNDSKFFDYDNDGDMDIFIAALSPGAERVYTNNGLGTYTLTGGVIQAISDSSLDVKVADVNSDGRYDVITAQGESGSPFINRLYMNVSGPIDTRAPVIVNTEQVPNAAIAGPFVVRTMILDAHSSDRGFHDKGVTLNWRLVGSPLKEGSFEQTPMKWVGNSVWRGVIPTQAASGTVEYFVTATDWANNLGTGPTKSFTLTLPCPADIDGNSIVNIDDLLAVINAWGQANAVHDVNVLDFVFEPASFSARAGDTVNWHWVAGLHTVTSGSGCVGNGMLNQPISAGSPLVTYVIPSSFSGNWPYFCTPHCALAMIGSIDVAAFPTDVDGSGQVNIDDLLAVINAWGNCD
jgi:plastocyanin